MLHFIFPIFWLLTKSPYQGAQTQLHCALLPFQKLESGKFYSDCAIKAETLNEQWESEAVKLWEYSENAVD